MVNSGCTIGDRVGAASQWSPKPLQQSRALVPTAVSAQVGRLMFQYSANPRISIRISNSSATIHEGPQQHRLKMFSAVFNIEI
jgi:hypothetical protein